MFRQVCESRSVASSGARYQADLDPAEIERGVLKQPCLGKSELPERDGQSDVSPAQPR
jgi:hypothetical protein